MTVRRHEIEQLANSYVASRGYGFWELHNLRMKAWWETCGALHSIRAARGRCRNPGDTSFKSYGGRGITIVDEWVNDPLSFVRYLGPRPTGWTLDRIDVNGNYEPGNVRWASPAQQATNKQIHGSREPMSPYVDWT